MKTETYTLTQTCISFNRLSDNAILLQHHLKTYNISYTQEPMMTGNNVTGNTAMTDDLLQYLLAISG